jgi:hypothetical protein
LGNLYRLESILRADARGNGRAGLIIAMVSREPWTVEGEILFIACATTTVKTAWSPVSGQIDSAADNRVIADRPKFVKINLS